MNNPSDQPDAPAPEPQAPPPANDYAWLQALLYADGSMLIDEKPPYGPKD